MIILAAVQNSLGIYFKIFGVMPDLLLTFIICMSLNVGNPWGTVIGIAGGILEDIFFMNGFGVNSLSCMITAYLMGLAEEKIYRDNIFIPGVFTFAGTIIKESIVLLLLYFTKSQHNFAYAFNDIIIWEAVYNTVLAALLSRIIYRIGDRCIRGQSRRFLP